jgi:WD40 repeat protein
MQYLLADVNGFLYVWEVTEMPRILLQTQFNKVCNQLVPGPPGRFLFLQREGVSMIDINRGTVKRSYQVHSGRILYITSVRDASSQVRLVTAGEDRFIRFWDPVDFSLREEQAIPLTIPMLSIHVGVRERAITSLVWAVTGHDEGKILFINITDHKQVELPSRHKNSISSLTVVSSEMKVVMMSCDYDGMLTLWSIDSVLENVSYAAVSLIKMWRGSDREILSSAAQWFGDQPIFATGGNDKIIRIWHEVDQQYVDQQLKGHTDSVTALVFEGFFLLSGGEDLTIRIWDTVNMVQLLMITRLHSAAVRQVFHIPGESKFGSCDAGGGVVIYDYTKRKEIWKMKHSSDCKCLYVDAAGGKLFACLKTELIPHEVGDALGTSLPVLTSSGNVSDNARYSSD